jgi:SMI1/KNR4 family protein SUKH-1
VDIDEQTEKIASQLRANGITGEPCDEWTISDLEQQLGVTFPAAYRAFLLIAGNGFAPWEGSVYAVDDVTDLQRRGRELPVKRGSALPSDAFAFFCHQGAAIAFFLLGDGEDPAVFEWVDYENPRPIEQVASSFRASLIKCKRQSDEMRSRL